LIVSAGALLIDNRTLTIVAGLIIAAGIGCFMVNVVKIARHWRVPELQPRVRMNAR
jgi:hypothetical protein